MESSSNNAQVRLKPQARACEACRSAKIRCQVGPQPGICKRCFDFKRECVFRTGPRTRRPKVPKGDVELPPPPGPSQTFSIDFSIPADQETTSTFEGLLEQHQRHFESLVPSSEEEEQDHGVMSSSSVTPSFSFSNMSTPASSSTGTTNSRPIRDLAMKPLFNLDSAGKLLQRFKSMLLYCPSIILSEDIDVRSMARDSPFVLLAILAVTSCSVSLQGHSLYDEEFRKVLGLKFVTGGERSLELLQGLLVYCSWYPFHLRPKHRQAFQYQRMAAEIIAELELDQESTFAARIESGLTEYDLENFRAYATSYYLSSFISNTWSKPSNIHYHSWLAKCCDLLEQHSALEQDRILVWQIRMHHICDEIAELQRSSQKPYGQSEHHRTLIRMGLESQLREWQSQIPPSIAMHPSLVMSSLFNDMYIVAAPLMSAFRARAGQQEVAVDPVKLLGTLQKLGFFFETVCTLPEGEMGHFSSADWGHLILTIILGYRLSLPLDICPSWDATCARQVFNFGAYLERLARDPDEAEKEEAAAVRKKTDCCTAFRVVLRSLKEKFDRKVAAAEAKEELTRRARECPMFDGSLDDYINLWDGDVGPEAMTYATSQSGTSTITANPVADLVSVPGETKPMAFLDLWTTMTLGWGQEDGTLNLNMANQNVDFGGQI